MQIVPLDKLKNNRTFLVSTGFKVYYRRKAFFHSHLDTIVVSEWWRV
jgi:hypothetical protein